MFLFTFFDIIFKTEVGVKMTRIKHELPRYLQVAIDFAGKIVDKHYKVGDRVYARSALASQYGVSSETSRRAMCVLEDVNIIHSVPGSGSTIVSYENAVAFINQYSSIRSLEDIRKNILANIEESLSKQIELKKQVEELIDKSSKFKDITPFVPYELKIPSDSPRINKTLMELNFWHNTSATVIAINHKDELILSPGPYANLKENDIIYFIGNEECYNRVLKFIFK